MKFPNPVGWILNPLKRMTQKMIWNLIKKFLLDGFKGALAAIIAALTLATQVPAPADLDDAAKWLYGLFVAALVGLIGALRRWATYKPELDTEAK